MSGGPMMNQIRSAFMTAPPVRKVR
jgi:hypothetical protein